MNDNLIDRIYECSFAPELWPGVLEDLTRLGGARGGSLFADNRHLFLWTASERIREPVSLYVQHRLWKADERRERLFRARHQGFMTDLDLFTPKEMDEDPFYTQFLRPRGCGWAVATALPMPTGDNLLLHFERSFKDGPPERKFVDRLDELRPHLARSAFMSARLQLERAQVASETLALLGLPALVLNEKGRALAANELIERDDEWMRWRADDYFSFADACAEKLLRESIAALAMTEAQPIRSFPLRGPEPGPGKIAHIVPIRRSARDIFVRCAAVLVLTPVVAPAAPPVELVRSLFDLTPAEARVARSLASGDTVEEVAAKSGVSHNTVRTQLRGVMDKTGCGRQAEVVALLTGLTPFRVPM
ncbi:MAG TPA: helix-turn-helix transcriptional regulator [Methylocystis sp.]|nr:helix-turn-helix transcriptional regulator [Methylocystis sp.]